MVGGLCRFFVASRSCSFPHGKPSGGTVRLPRVHANPKIYRKPGIGSFPSQLEQGRACRNGSNEIGNSKIGGSAFAPSKTYVRPENHFPRHEQGESAATPLMHVAEIYVSVRESNS